MFHKNTTDKNTIKLFKITEDCYDNLEMANALLSLLCEKFTDNKNTNIILSKAILKIKTATELVLKIQSGL